MRSSVGPGPSWGCSWKGALQPGVATATRSFEAAESDRRGAKTDRGCDNPPTMDREDGMTDGTARTVTVAPGSELATLIAEASSSGEPLIVESGASSYRLEVRPVASADRSVGAGGSDEPVGP